MGLLFAADEPVHSFSRGMQQRLSIARALVHKPPILLMDEPYTGLDERAKGDLSAILSQLAQSKHTVFLITHDFEQGLEQSDQALILVNGRIVDTCNPQRLKREEFRRRYLDLIGGAK